MSTKFILWSVFFYVEFQFRHELIKTVQDIVYVGFVYVVYDEDVVDVAKVTFNVVFQNNVIDFSVFRKYRGGRCPHG